MQVDIQNLTKKFGDVTAVADVSLDIRDGEFVAFLGPSGCGKTTTLLMLAGIYKPTDGTITFGERIVNLVPPRERNIGMVFQSYALYPHMTVFGNIAYPLKLKNVSRADQQERVKRVADVMGIGELLDRKPAQLSGGQQQRVALGRALVKEPDILLFDEPLSNLDARLRLTMRAEIKALQKRLGITSVYVTHDQVEALTMADRIAVMNKGRLEAYATPEDLYDHPRTTFIANFVGNPPINMVDVELAQENGQVVARCAAFTVPLDSERVRKAVAHGRKLTMGIRAEDITLGDDAALTGEVYAVEPLGREDMLDVRIGAESFFALATPQQRMRAGDRIGLHIDAERLQFFDPATGKSVLWE
ncbi:MAG: ABC transporter ATP-binding protein [Chloroflexi bacterium]|jgi:ABC-type sugar transport system ATPase subunit|nr:MAG: putative ABC transporter ATP-binding protein [Chloroflexi bacterium OLB13]MCC6566057.1 ABC transporter ATP-binding protein [Chloroflexota bacterium]MDL1914664.1 ABC transporter ATP-binding protein [Anaerolineae bacterium CFX4]MEB2364568.1 ABC transporter ATP-binding protein [Chloroflexota bacterium]OQY81503.1 MAG: sugar ABC transporter ATP-binding protein [Anaerolineae bacterium UTCFX5]